MLSKKYGKVRNVAEMIIRELDLELSNNTLFMIDTNFYAYHDNNSRYQKLMHELSNHKFAFIIIVIFVVLDFYSFLNLSFLKTFYTKLWYS